VRLGYSQGKLLQKTFEILLGALLAMETYHIM
jgi:hypothetical protein